MERGTDGYVKYSGVLQVTLVTVIPRVCCVWCKILSADGVYVELFRSKHNVISDSVWDVEKFTQVRFKKRQANSILSELFSLLEQKIHARLHDGTRRNQS